MIRTVEELKKLLLSKYPTLSDDAASKSNSKGIRISVEHAFALEKAGSIFSVKDDEEYIYPLFQLDNATGEPKPVIRELIDIFDLSRNNPWELFIWLTSPTGLLGGAVPIDLIEGAPSTVLQAARRERAEPEF